MTDGIKLMADIDQRFRRETGLNHSRHFAIFYSRIQQSKLMVLGINPGGSPNDSAYPIDSLRFDVWRHEYVDENYRIAAIMRPALMRALGAERAEDIRGVPKANVIFHRSPDTLGMDLKRLAAICAPFLKEIIAFVDPEIIVCEGNASREHLFANAFSNVIEDKSATIIDLYRGRSCRFFTKHQGYCLANRKKVTVLSTGHPSTFGHLSGWHRVEQALAQNLGHDYLPHWG